MKYTGHLNSFATHLLKARLDGLLKAQTDVLDIARKCQPESGFTNTEWTEICKFILKLEPANIVSEAKKLADEYGLEIVV